jgi:hypothetical protein
MLHIFGFYFEDVSERADVPQEVVAGLKNACFRRYGTLLDDMYSQ